jgi:hypothetical protein
MLIELEVVGLVLVRQLVRRLVHRLLQHHSAQELMLRR